MTGSRNMGKNLQKYPQVEVLMGRLITDIYRWTTVRLLTIKGETDKSDS